MHGFRGRLQLFDTPPPPSGHHNIEDASALTISRLPRRTVVQASRSTASHSGSMSDHATGDAAVDGSGGCPDLPSDIWGAVARAPLATEGDSVQAWARLSLVSQAWRTGLRGSPPKKSPHSACLASPSRSPLQAAHGDIVHWVMRLMCTRVSTSHAPLISCFASPLTYALVSCSPTRCQIPCQRHPCPRHPCPYDGGC